ncbi:MAG: hypothetical protein LBO05_00975, partial [Deltaproteobacteria bacterium]|nr:hypothetical protein [Deltaproteobacteria bacterium]
MRRISGGKKFFLGRRPDGRMDGWTEERWGDGGLLPGILIPQGLSSGGDFFEKNFSGGGALRDGQVLARRPGVLEVVQELPHLLEEAA